MPQAIDLVVKNGASTPVDKTYVLNTPASGYGSVAEWVLKEGAVSSVFPRFTAAARPSTRGNARNLQLKFKLPSSYTDTVTGNTLVRSAFEFNATVVVPDDFPEALKSDAVAFATNLLQTALVKALIRDALPAT